MLSRGKVIFGLCAILLLITSPGMATSRNKMKSMIHGLQRPVDCQHAPIIIFGGQLVEVLASFPLEEREREFLEEQGRRVDVPPKVVRLYINRVKVKSLKEHWRFEMELEKSNGSRCLQVSNGGHGENVAFDNTTRNLVTVLKDYAQAEQQESIALR